MPRTTARQTNLEFDRIAATCAALVIVGLAVFLLVRNEEINDPRLFFVLRMVMSFSTAVLGATIPGFLEVGWSGAGLVVRAGGALALFVLTFFYTPDLVKDKGQTGQIISAPGGVAVGRDVKSSPITITPRPPGN